MSEYKRVGDNLFIRQSTGKYYAIIRKNGVQARKSLKTTDREIADVRLGNLRCEMRVAKLNPNRKNLPTFALAVEEAIAAFSRERLGERYLEGIKYHLRMAARSFLGPIKMHRIGTEQIKSYLEERNRLTSGRTANLDLIHLRKLFRFARDRGWRWDEPTRDLEPFAHRAKTIVIPTREQVVAVLQWLRRFPDHPDYPKAADFVEFLGLSGCRLQGAQTIRWEDIDFDRVIFKVTEKFSKTRIVDIFPWLLPFLQARRKEKGLLFPPAGYNPKKALANACAKAEVPRFTFHGMRHFFATECLERGISAPTIAGWLGHSDNGILVMRLYGNHLRRKHFASEAQKLPSVLFEPAPLPASVQTSTCPAPPGAQP
jgi:integrase